MSAETLYLLDGYNLVFRSYFAFIRNPLRNAHNQNRSAVFGFFRTLSFIIREYNPTQMVVVFDSIEPSFRHNLYTDYKGTRDKTPEDLISQIPIVEEILTALEIAFIRVSGYEADDVIATLATQAHKKEQPVTIISADKDLLQLVNSNTSILRPSSGGFEEINQDKVEELKGVRPAQILDLLALCGDSADNIPGVAGIGPKTAVKLLQQYHTIDSIYANIQQVTPASVKEKLLGSQEDALLSKKLVSLEYNVSTPPIESTLNIKCHHTVPIFKRENMHALAKEYLHMRSDEEETEELLISPSHPLLGDQNYTLIQDIEVLNEWVAQAHAAGICAIDTETDNLDPMQAHLVGFSLAHAPQSACYIPIQGPLGALVLGAGQVREALRPLIEDPSVALIGHNIKYDYKVLKRWGLTPTNIATDTMVMAWLLDTNSNQYSLDALANKYLHHITIPFPQRAKKEGFAAIDLAEATKYAAEDALVTFALAKVLTSELQKNTQSWDLYRTIEMPLLPILAEMEYTGIYVESAFLVQYKKGLSDRIAVLEKEIHQISGVKFNINSPKQLQHILFENLGLTPLKKTKTGYSTDNAVLSLLAPEHPLPQLVLRYRQLTKLLSTYVEALPLMINHKTGRIHTTFNINGSATGRLSSTDPNLQNIPIKDEEGKKIRNAFTTKDQLCLIGADYSQIELVLLAHQSADPILVAAFQQGEDIHSRTASLIFKIAPDQVTGDQRRIGKTINFGVIYGMSPFRLSRELKISQHEARQFIDDYFNTYTGVATYMQQTLEEVRSTGVVYTLLGRARPIIDINSRNTTVRSAAERVAINTAIQGSAADIIKRAMINIHGRIHREKLASKMLLQVHDEIIVEGPRTECNQVVTLLKEEMETCQSLSVPLHAEVTHASNWGALK